MDSSAMDRPASASESTAGAFTPGPWRWDCGERYADIYTDGGDTIIAHFNNCISAGKANARLIAAAPDLYEALKAFIAYDDCGDPESFNFMEMYDLAVKKARAALAKAEGR